MENNNGSTLIELMIIICISTVILSFILLPYENNPNGFCNVYTLSGSYTHVEPESIKELDGMLYFKSFDKYVEVSRTSADIECSHKFNTN